MSDSALGKLIPLALVGGAAYAIYELFFAHPVATGTTTVNAGSGAGTNLVPAPNQPVVNTSPTSGPEGGPCAKSGALAKILALAQKDLPARDLGPNGAGTLTIDEWVWYGNKYCTGLLDQLGISADGLFPGQEDRGGALNWNAFAGYATQRGLSGPRALVRAPAFGKLAYIPGRPMAWSQYTGFPTMLGTHLVRGRMS